MEYGPESSIRRELDIADGKYVPQEITADEAERIRQWMKDVDRLFKREDIKAKYKLEVQFGKNRTSRGFPFAGAVTCWLNGNMLHGGGDEKIYECPKCGRFLSKHHISGVALHDKEGQPLPGSYTFCPDCNQAHRSEEVIGERFYVLTEQHWATAILRMFQKLEMNADIYLKYHPEDIRYKARMETARNRGGEELLKARVQRGLHIYPLKNIIKDTQHGADLYRRIRVFINV